MASEKEKKKKLLTLGTLSLIGRCGGILYFGCVLVEVEHATCFTSLEPWKRVNWYFKGKSKRLHQLCFEKCFIFQHDNDPKHTGEKLTEKQEAKHLNLACNVLGPESDGKICGQLELVQGNLYLWGWCAGKIT